jgi:WD40 repeat protein
MVNATTSSPSSFGSFQLSHYSLQELPKELIHIILIKGGLSLQDISNCSLISKKMRVITSEGEFWKWLFYRDFGCLLPSNRFPEQTYQSRYRYYNDNVDKGVYASSNFDQFGSPVCFLAAQENQLISSHFDHTIKIWDLDTKKCLNTLEGHTWAVNGIAYAPDGTLVSVSGDGVIKYWDSGEKRADTLECVGTFPFNGNAFMAILFIGKKYFFGPADHTIRSCDWDSGELLKPLEGHTEQVSCFACAGEELFISGSEDSTIRVWDLQKWACCAVLEGHTKAVNTLAVTPAQIVSGSSDCTIRVWDKEKYTCLHVFDKHESPIWNLTFKAERLFSRSFNGRMNVWNLRTGEHCYSIQEPGEQPPYYGLGFVKGRLYTGCLQGGIQVRDFGARDDEVLKELADLFRNGAFEEAQEAMKRYSRMPKAVLNGVYLEFASILGPDHAQQEEVTVEQMALAIEQYIAKHYSYSS